MKLADAYGWRSERVDRPGDVDAAIERMLSADGPYLLEVVVSREQNVYPMVAPGSSIEDSLGAIDLAVGAVRVDMPRSRDAARQAVGGVSPAACSLGADDVVPGKENR